MENNIAFTVTVRIASFEVIGELQRERLHYSCATAFSWNGRTRGQFLQQGAEYIRCSLVIIYMERGQWKASFTREKSACLAEVSVMEHILWEFPNSQNSWGN